MLGDGPVWALGMMSGTSLDGVDAAMVLTDGEEIFEFGETAYRPYSEVERSVIRAALGKWDGVEAATELVEIAHAELMDGFRGADIVGFHGQTLAHDPRGRGTFQVGNGALLAEAFGLPVVWDFRSADVEMGGQGAPLVPFFHHACAKWISEKQPLVFLNLGGIGNVTWVDPIVDRPDAKGALLAFDTGPANGPVNDLMMARLGLAMDKDGALAEQGQVAEGVLETFLEGAFFHRLPPKSLDRGAFTDLENAVSDLSDADAAATLSAAVAASVVKAAEHFPCQVEQVLVTGGGRKNPVIMGMLRAGLQCSVEPVESVGLDGDMLEAQAFAYLAVRVARGLPTTSPSTTGVAAAIGGGKISRPSGEF